MGGRGIAIECGNEKDLQSAVAYIGPVAVAVDAQSNAFRVSQCTTIEALVPDVT